MQSGSWDARRIPVTKIGLLLAGALLASVIPSRPAAAQSDIVIGPVAIASFDLPAPFTVTRPEGNTGLTAFVFPVVLNPSSNQTVSIAFSAPATHPQTTATGGASCSGAVDFIAIENGAITFAPGVTRQDIVISVCGESVAEPDETFVVIIARGSGALARSTAQGRIVDDDRPSVSINNPSVVEGTTLIASTLVPSRSAVFTVSLSQPIAEAVVVKFTTRDSIARGSTGPGNCSSAGVDYLTTSGTLTIPPRTATGEIRVPICSDRAIEPNETFFVDLAQPDPANAVLNPRASRGVGTIIDDDGTGTFSVLPESPNVEVGERLAYSLTWTVPEGRVWRDLKDIDLRIRPDRGETGEEALLWVRWDEASDLFSLCRSDGDSLVPPRCGPGAAPGSAAVLEGRGVLLHLADTRVEGSGPTGRDVALTFSLSFEGVGHFVVDAAAEDDFGQRDDFREPVPASD